VNTPKDYKPIGMEGDPRALNRSGASDWVCKDCGMTVVYWARHLCPSEKQLREIIREELRAFWAGRKP
jgi:hypothetical protein